MADDDRFYVESLSLENFRGFEQARFDSFDHGFNLLVGENGAGKSSILLALASLFFKMGLPYRDLNGQRLLSPADIRLINFSAGGVTTVKMLENARLVARAWNGELELIASDLLSIGRSSPRYPPYLMAQGQGDFVPSRLGSGDLEDKPAPIVAFYRTNRLFSHSVGEVKFKSKPNMRENAFEGWEDAGLDGTALANWIKNETLAVLQQERRAPGATNSHRHALKLVQYSVSLSLDGARSVEFDADLDDMVIEFANGQRTEFLKMSDGQRALVGLFADIARRAIALNVSFLGEKTLEQTPGLVLIDEIDLHLHPKWQRQIVPALKKVFPKIQFFATTHSPQVIGECKPEEIVLLRDGQQVHPPGSFGMDSNWILECVMDAPERNEIVKKQIDAVSQAIDEGRLEDAKVGIAELRRELPAVAPDIVGAENYIWNVEHDPGEAAE